MKVVYDKPISIKVWFSGGSTSRNIDNVKSIESNAGLMMIRYRNRNNDNRTMILNFANVNTIEEL